MPRLLHRALRFVGRIVVGLTLLLVVGGVATLLYLRSSTGRNRLVAQALAQLRPLFPGGTSIGRTEHLDRGFVVHDLRINDLEGEAAIRVQRIELRYTRTPILSRTVALTLVDARGVEVVSRTLKNGRNSLATFVRVPPSSSGRAQSLPIAIDVEQLIVNGRFTHLPRGVPLSAREANVELELRGSASVSHSLSLRVGAVHVGLARPVHAQIDAHGTFDFADAPSLRNVALHVSSDAAALRRYLDGVALRGPIELYASAAGPAARLRADLVLTAPHHQIAISSRAQLARGGVEVHALRGRAPFAHVDAHGRVHFDGRFTTTARAEVNRLDALDLFGLTGLGGRAVVDGTVGHERRAWQVKLEAQGDELALPGQVRVRALTASIDTQDLTGRALVEAHGLSAGKVALTSLKLEATGTARELRLALDSADPEQSVLQLRVAGRPTRSEGRLVGVEARLERLRFASLSNVWREERPTRISADFAASRYEVERVDLHGPGGSQLALAAKLHERTVDAAFVELKRFDLSKLSAVLSPGHVLAHSDVYFHATARGPFDELEAHARASGRVDPRSDKDIIHLAGQAEAHLVHRRLTGKVFLTIGGQRAIAQVDMPMPLRPDAPISASYDAKSMLSAGFSELLAPKFIQFQPLALFLLNGTYSAQVRLSGTTSDPEVHAAARLAKWEAAGAHGEAGVSLEYRHRSLGASLTASFSSLPGGGGSGGGRITATTRLGIDLAPLLSGRGPLSLTRDAPVKAHARLEHVKIDHLPVRAFNIIPPLEHGTVDGEIDIDGTRRHPRLTAHLDASGFEAVSLGITAIGAKLDGRIDGAASTTEVSVSVGGTDAIRVRGSLDAGRNADPLRADFVNAPLAVEVKTLDFPLQRLALFAGLKGRWHGRATITGTLSRPEARGELELEGLHLGSTSFRRCAMSGSFRQMIAEAHLAAEQSTGAQLALDGKFPLRGGPLAASLHAERFVFDVRAEKLPGARMLRGVLDGDLRISGTTHAPLAHGRLAFADGALALGSTAITYHQIQARLHVDEHALVLDELALRAASEGRLSAHGRLALDPGAHQALVAELSAHRFPFQQRGIALLLDGDLELHGARGRDGVLSGRLRVKGGGAQLPDREPTRLLHPTVPLTDVRILERKHGRVVRAAEPLRLDTISEGPFVLKGKEVNARAQGGITVELNGGRTVLRGALHTEPGGWIELFGRRYDLERGQLSFDGSEQPLLDLRIARRMPKATIGVDITGRADQPHLEAWSRPPVYTRPQVVGLVLAGDPSVTGVSPASLQHHSQGAISTLVVSAIKHGLLPDLPLDVFRLGETRATGSSVAGAQLEVGKYLTETLYIGYAYQLGVDRVGAETRSNRNAARIDYRFGRDWKVEGSSGDEGVGGLDLFWIYRP